MNSIKTFIKELHDFLILWLTQSFSSLGSSMTNFAMIIWSYQQNGSSLQTALLAVCSYLPYVVMSVFAGALSDRWNKKISILVCDSFAAGCSCMVLILLLTGKLEVWHLYALNALNGLMNTVQQPAGDVSISLLTPKKYYQRVSGMKSFSNSLVNVMTPVLATAFLSVFSVQTVIIFDLLSFAVAFVALAFFVKIPEIKKEKEVKESLLKAAKAGLSYLGQNRGILNLILFLSGINLIASAYNAALPAMILSRNGGSEVALGLVTMAEGVATIVGSLIVSLLPAPKSRVRVICNTLLFSMSTENFFLAFGRSVPIWCIGAVLGWIVIPIMGANLDVLLRNHIPIEMQGRVYSARNTLQFFTIPIGYFLGGILVDKVFEPIMKLQTSQSILTFLFGSGKGTGAAMLFLILAFAGIFVCMIFRRNTAIRQLDI